MSITCIDKHETHIQTDIVTYMHTNITHIHINKYRTPHTYLHGEYIHITSFKHDIEYTEKATYTHTYIHKNTSA